MLDVGAGYGLLSSILYTKGYEVEIVEPEHSSYYLRGRKFKHYKTTIEEFLHNQKSKYDIIIMMDVIEHLKDPLKILKQLKSFLNKDSIIVIQTPNYKSLMANLCINWSWWMVSDHKFFFSPNSMRLFFKKAGYTVSGLETYEDIEDFKKNLDGNFASIRTSLVRKLIKGLFYSVFSPFYIFFRNILWRFHYGGLIFTIASPVL